MNPIPLLVIVLATLVFEQALIGDQVAQTVQPFLLKVDTAQRDCPALLGGTVPDVACAIGNLARPLLGGLATVFNAIVIVAGLATFQVPGAPWWIQATFGSGISATLIWAIVELIRGKGS